MRYTMPIVVEWTLESLGIEPLQATYADQREVNGFSSYTRERRRQDMLWINDNSGGQHPYASCGAQHCLHIASRAEEAGGLPECEAGRSLVVLPHTVRLKRLVGAMERCFAYYNAWSEGLLDIVAREGDWDELLQAGHEVLKNPMIFYNRSMRVMAYSTDDGARDPLWVDTVRQGTAMVESPKQTAELMRFLSEVERHDAPFRHVGEGMSEPFWCAPIRVGDVRLGMVNVVEYHRPLSPGCLDLLSVFSGYVAIAMRRSNRWTPAPDALPRQLMADLLDGGIGSPDLLNSRLIAVDWQALNCFRFVILTSTRPFLSPEQWSSYYGRLAALGMNVLGCVLDRPEPCIALLLTGTGPDRFARPLEVIGQFCAMNHLRAGFSDVYDDLLTTPRFFRQAVVALELLEGETCYYGQARYRRVLRYLRRHPFREDLMHPAVARLAELDREEGSEYILTLRALMEHGFNQLETADALGIHRTTLAYRLRRIQEMTDLRLSGGGQFFHVAVSLKLMDEDMNQ